jgi:hypothetical protein
LINEVVGAYPEAKSMEMETFLLFHLANSSRIKIVASSAAIVVNNIFITKIIVISNY